MVPYSKANVNGDSAPSIPEESNANGNDQSATLAQDMDTPESDLSLWKLAFTFFFGFYFQKQKNLLSFKRKSFTLLDTAMQSRLANALLIL